MPTSSDWAAFRMVLVMAAVAFFMGPWTWQQLLLLAVLLPTVTYFIEWVTQWIN